jgi:hypothetical protein
MSEEFWQKLKDKPPIKEGLRMKLYHLTGHARVLGYVKTLLFTKDIEGTHASFELEAYVVRGMKVPLLLGEDFQTTYELGVKRFVTGANKVLVGQTGRVIPASSTDQVDLGFEIRQAYMTKSFIRRKTVSRVKARQRRLRIEDLPVFAAEDVLISAASVHNIKVNGQFEGRDEWVVEKVVISAEDSSILAAPTTLIQSDKPYLPIANPGVRPRYIRAGEIVGYLKDPETYWDSPNETELPKYEASAVGIKSIIEGSLRAQDLASAVEKPTPETDDMLEDDPNWGPKTMALPEDPFEGDVCDLVSLGPDIPPEILPKVKEVLWKNSAAFRIGGRLGKVEARVNIPLQPDTQPISVPMYGASPAKREVIDKQVKAWFEAEVVEPSVSPWGFPCVVTYRNGKPRLVIDYRKLNTHTIPDEFPIPRQSEIIQALSGAQVLSPFDALAGFTQLEMAKEAKEKTAFRCHLGLWQFKRMPFGLRNGPSIFRRLMQEVLSPYLWLFALVYIHRRHRRLLQQLGGTSTSPGPCPILGGPGGSWGILPSCSSDRRFPGWGFLPTKKRSEP